MKFEKSNRLTVVIKCNEEQLGVTNLKLHLKLLNRKSQITW